MGDFAVIRDKRKTHQFIWADLIISNGSFMQTELHRTCSWKLLLF